MPAHLDAFLDGWNAQSRKLLGELMDDAATDLQRQLLERAVIAGHTVSEVHAFADELRALTDEECFEACTADGGAGAGFTVAQLLQAESDPIFAFQLKGGSLSPKETRSVRSPDRETVITGETEMVDPVQVSRAKRQGFSAESGRLGVLRVSDFPSEVPALTRNSRTNKEEAGPAVRLLEDVLHEATRGLGLGWKEYEVDVAHGLTLEEAIRQATESLHRGLPVPLVVGNVHSAPLKFVLMLQVSVSGTTRAFQLYEPLEHEVVWANEKTLLGRSELPFDNKALRKVVRIVLPAHRTS